MMSCGDFDDCDHDELGDDECDVMIADCSDGWDDGYEWCNGGCG